MIQSLYAACINGVLTPQSVRFNAFASLCLSTRADLIGAVLILLLAVLSRVSRRGRGGVQLYVARIGLNHAKQNNSNIIKGRMPSL